MLAELDGARRVVAGHARAVDVGDVAFLAHAVVCAVEVRVRPKLLRAHLRAPLDARPVDVRGVACELTSSAPGLCEQARRETPGRVLASAEEVSEFS